MRGLESRHLVAIVDASGRLKARDTENLLSELFVHVEFLIA
ncbi:MAG: hypothetical protein USCAAHI_00036 [Beijerinckiaceae bacterium]|nr:MAG: hypothetical protein USCAAHI_00036 [Beijerinckiaceae bacterium]